MRSRKVVAVLDWNKEKAQSINFGTEWKDLYVGHRKGDKKWFGILDDF